MSMAQRLPYDPDRKNKIETYIRNFIAEHGFGPTMRTIMSEFGFRSPRAVSWYTNKLKREGKFIYGGVRRGLVPVETPIKNHLGEVVATVHPHQQGTITWAQDVVSRAITNGQIIRPEGVK